MIQCFSSVFRSNKFHFSSPFQQNQLKISRFKLKVCVAANLKYFEIEILTKFSPSDFQPSYIYFFLLLGHVSEEIKTKKNVTRIATISTRVVILCENFEVFLFDCNHQSMLINRLILWYNVFQAFSDQIIFIFLLHFNKIIEKFHVSN